MTIRTAQEELVSTLKKIYDERESANIADWVLELITGRKRIDRMLIKDELLTPIQELDLQRIQKELATNRPVQYVLGEAWFAGMKFYVNEAVLIPRPETEELVMWAASLIRNSELGVRNLLDVGSGSGCIPISMKKQVPGLVVSSVDVSEEALVVARQNAAALQADVSFLQFDFLDESNWAALPVFDVIISNPPYIKASERKEMAVNVLEFEPAIALFVPDEDALLFYRKIAAFAKNHLNKGGNIFLEINEALGKETSDLFKSEGYAVELKKDMQGKERMLKINS